MPGRSALIPILSALLLTTGGMSPAPAQDAGAGALPDAGPSLQPPRPGDGAVLDTPDGTAVAPRAAEPGDGPASWDEHGITGGDLGNVEAVLPEGRTVPRDPQGGREGTSPAGPAIFPDPIAPPEREREAAGINAACAALTDPVQRDRCRTGSVVGQPDLPPTPN